MKTITEELINEAIGRAKLLNTDFSKIDSERLRKAAIIHLEQGKDWVDGICFDLSYND